MKILRFNDNRIGVLKNEARVIDVSDVIEHREDKGPQRAIEEVIERFDDLKPTFEQRSVREDGIPLDTVTLLAPIPRPSRCLAAFSNYVDREGRNPNDVPMEFFYKDPDLLGPEGTIELLDLPPVMVFQPEAELAYVMKRTPLNVAEARALDYVFGYVPFFDISARGMTRRTQLVPKGQRTYGPCGPWITTSDEVPDPHDVNVKSWVNGSPRQDYSTEHMARKIHEQVAWLSRFIELHPGDTIATGTYHIGLGPINDGDVLEIEIAGMGKARFHVKGYGPRKDVDFMPGRTPVPRPEGGITWV